MKELRLERGLSALERGRVHGETCARDIQDLAAIRTDLIRKAWDAKDATLVRERAKMHIPILADYDQDLYQEFQGVAQGSGLSETDLLILNQR